MALKGFSAPARALHLVGAAFSVNFITQQREPASHVAKERQAATPDIRNQMGLTHSLLAFRFLDITLASGESFESHSPAVSADLRIGVIGHRSDLALANASRR